MCEDRYRKFYTLTFQNPGPDIPTGEGSLDISNANRDQTYYNMCVSATDSMKSNMMKGKKNNTILKH